MLTAAAAVPLPLPAPTPAPATAPALAPAGVDCTLRAKRAVHLHVCVDIRSNNRYVSIYELLGVPKHWYVTHVLWQVVMGQEQLWATRPWYYSGRYGETGNEHVCFVQTCVRVKGGVGCGG